MRCAVYARVSTDMLAQKDSLENQRSFFEHYIMQKEWRLHDIYPDEGISGTSTAKRLELQRLMKDAESRKFEVVLVKSLSRWARDTVDSITLVRRLKSYGICLITVDDNYNSFDDVNEMRLQMYSMFAQQESESASVRVKFGIAERSRNGVFHGTPPYGYDKVAGKLVPNPQHAQTVRLIYRLYLYEGWGWQKIANYLTDKKVPSPRRLMGAKNAGHAWHETAVKIILSNRHYTGDLVQGRSKVDRGNKLFNQERGYKMRQQVEESRWIIVEDAHTAIISREEFTAVQEKLANKARTKFRGRGKKSLFARLAFCSDCGKGMNYKNDREGYVCATYQKRGSKACASHFIRHDTLKEMVLSDLRALSENALNQDSLLEESLLKAQVNSNQAATELSQVQNRSQRLQQEQLELVRALTRNVIDDDTFQMSNAALKEEQNALKERERILEGIVSHQQENECFVQKFREEIKRFVAFQIDDEEVLRDVLHRLIECIEVKDGNEIVIHYSFENPLSSGAE
ncbi:recombinase family protein [Alicyclobacillus curvatus]|nr:recombinase family protein [Alicyclobacillus curvatus]